MQDGPTDTWQRMCLLGVIRHAADELAAARDEVQCSAAMQAAERVLTAISQSGILHDALAWQLLPGQREQLTAQLQELVTTSLPPALATEHPVLQLAQAAHTERETRTQWAAVDARQQQRMQDLANHQPDPAVAAVTTASASAAAQLRRRHKHARRCEARRRHDCLDREHDRMGSKVEAAVQRKNTLEQALLLTTPPRPTREQHSRWKAAVAAAIEQLVLCNRLARVVALQREQSRRHERMAAAHTSHQACHVLHMRTAEAEAAAAKAQVLAAAQAAAVTPSPADATGEVQVAAQSATMTPQAVAAAAQEQVVAQAAHAEAQMQRAAQAAPAAHQTMINAVAAAAAAGAAVAVQGQAAAQAAACVLNACFNAPTTTAQQYAEAAASAAQSHAVAVDRQAVEQAYAVLAGQQAQQAVEEMRHAQEALAGSTASLRDSVLHARGLVDDACREFPAAKVDSAVDTNIGLDYTAMLQQEWQRLLAHVLVGCTLCVRSDPGTSDIGVAATASRMPDLAAVLKQANASRQQWQQYKRVMDRLRFPLAPMPHFVCEHMHLEKLGMFELVKWLVDVDTSALHKWRVKYAAFLMHFVGQGGDALEPFSLDLAARIRADAKSFWKKNNFAKTRSLEAEKASYGFLFDRLDSLGSRNQSFGWFLTTDGVSLHVQLQRKLEDAQATQPVTGPQKLTLQQRRAAANAVAFADAQRALFGGLEWPQAYAAADSMPDNGLGRKLLGTVRPLDMDFMVAKVQVGQSVHWQPVPATPVPLAVAGNVIAGTTSQSDSRHASPTPLSHIARLTGVDPGSTHLFVGATANHGVRGDGRDGGDGAVYKLHNRLYRQACGFSGERRWRERHLLRCGFKQVEQSLADLGSKHTGNWGTFQVYVTAVLQHLLAGKAAYGCVRARQWSLRVHILKQKQMHRICQGMAFGATGVKGRWSKFDGWHSVVGPGGVTTKAEIPPVAIVGLGSASAGWGSAISRPISAPRAALTDLFRREYTSSGGVQRGVHRPDGSRCSMHLISVDEHRSSQTCSRCFHSGDLSQLQQHKLKRCQQGTLLGGPNRQPQQQHDIGLVLDRDVNAARVITARAVHDLLPGWMHDQGQLQQLRACLWRRDAAGGVPA